MATLLVRLQEQPQVAALALAAVLIVLALAYRALTPKKGGKKARKPTVKAAPVAKPVAKTTAKPAKDDGVRRSGRHVVGWATVFKHTRSQALNPSAPAVATPRDPKPSAKALDLAPASPEKVRVQLSIGHAVCEPLQRGGRAIPDNSDACLCHLGRLHATDTRQDTRRQEALQVKLR